MTTETPLITGVDFITVPTRDFEKAREFYGDVLGLPCSGRWGDMPAAEFEAGTVTIAVISPTRSASSSSMGTDPRDYQCPACGLDYRRRSGGPWQRWGT